MIDDPAVMERYRTMAEWYALGLVNPDAAQLTETSVDTTKQRISFVQAWPGYDFSVCQYGYDTAMTCYFGPNLSSDGVQGPHERALRHAGRRSEARMAAALKYIELVPRRQALQRHHALWRCRAITGTMSPRSRVPKPAPAAVLRTEDGLPATTIPGASRSPRTSTLPSQ